MVGNGGGEREPHFVVREGPRRAGSLPGRHAGLERLQRHGFRLAPQVGRKRFQETRDCSVERAVGHHGSHDRTHARIGVGLTDGLQSFRGRGRELEAQVVGGGASFPDHLHRSDERGEVLVLESSPAGDPRRCVEQQLQGPAIADALGKVVVPVGVGVDKARHEQAAAGVERGSLGGRGHSRWADLAHGIPFDQDVGRFRRVPLDVEQPSAPDDRVHCCTSILVELIQAARRPPR